VHALRVLEFDAITDALSSHCETELGAAHAADLVPSFEPDEVWRLLSLTREAHDLLAKAAPASLRPLRDLRAQANRAQKGGVLGGMELRQVAEALAASRALRAHLSNKRADYPGLWLIAEGLIESKRLEDKLLESIDPSGEVADAASATLQQLRARKQSAASRIVERIHSYTTAKTRELLSDPIYTQRDGRYVIPVKAENKGKVRGIVHDTSASGQTVYVEPEDVVQLGNALREIEGAERAEVQRILTSLSAQVGSVATELTGAIEAAALLDLHLAKARLAYAMKASLPQPSKGHGMIVQQGRHPLLEPQSAVPLDLSIGFEQDGVLITGPNTGGKTVVIKTVGLFALMAQAGLFLPALDVRLGPFTQVWADIGDEQSLQQSLSTFSGHIKNISEAMKRLVPGALVLLDEVGAGTDPAEGAALAKAILIELRNRGAKILASTHYGELKAFAYENESFHNAAMEFDVKTLRPTYRLIMGAPGASHALRIAERYGIPKAVVERAREGLGEAHLDIAKMLEGLETAQKQARLAQSEADRRSAELKQKERRAEEKLAQAEEVRRNVHAKASQMIDEALREIRLEAARLFEELKQAPRETKAQDKVRQQLRELQEVGRDFAQELHEPKPKRDQPQQGVAVAKGMTVRVESYGQNATVLSDPKDGKVVVQMGPLKLTVPVSQAIPLESPKPAAQARATRNVRLEKAQTATTELHLRAMRAEEAVELLERFIDDAVLAGLPSVRIVHGKGQGILRKITQDFLRRYPHVKSYRDGEPSEGGHGVTIAVLS
jgi:DNA mismatch repair protein MutS2